MVFMTKQEIEKALLSGNGTHVGSKLTDISLQMFMELRMLKLVGRDGGLTRKGSILAASVRDRELERAFG